MLLTRKQIAKRAELTILIRDKMKMIKDTKFNNPMDIGILLAVEIMQKYDIKRKTN